VCFQKDKKIFVSKTRAVCTKHTCSACLCFAIFSAIIIIEVDQLSVLKSGRE